MLRQKREFGKKIYSYVMRIIYVIILVLVVAILVRLYREVYSYKKYVDKVELKNISSNQCVPPPPKDDDTKCGSRIADRKCCQYMWEMNHKLEILKYKKCSTDDFGIIGGNNASPGEFPHMVALGWPLKPEFVTKYHRYEFKCGGSLISENFVLTAGHCTKIPVNEYTKVSKGEPKVVRIGGENISDEKTYALSVFDKNSNMIDIVIKNITKHPDYRSPFCYYDVALIELIKKVKFTLTTHPACVSSSWIKRAFKTVQATGWGVVDKSSSRTSEILQVASLDIFEHKNCLNFAKKLKNRHFPFLKKHQICAGVMKGGVDTCQGDSGGPIQIRLNTTYGSMHRIIGVTSMGKKCATSKTPGIYISVDSVLSWIEKKVWPEEYGGRIGTKK